MNELKFAVQTENSIYQCIIAEDYTLTVTKTFVLRPTPMAIPQEKQLTEECRSIEILNRRQMLIHFCNGQEMLSSKIISIIPTPTQ